MMNMSEAAIYYRNKITHGLYRHLLKPIFFSIDPEVMHERMTDLGSFLGEHSFGRKMTGSMLGYQNLSLEQEILGIRFKNPVGLSAGFDKDAKLTGILPFVGFGFAEAGSITGKECAGNPKPRLWRLPESKSLAVYYGLKNEGCEKIAKRLSGKKFEIPLGMSVAMTNCHENLDTKKAVMDYAHAFRTIEHLGDYIAVNVSCPNAKGGQPFLVPYRLDYLLDILDEIPSKKPIFLKISPDLSEEKMDEILSVVKKHRIDGIICTNLTKKNINLREDDRKKPTKGGFSGKAVDRPSDEIISCVYRKTRDFEKQNGKKFVIIGSGGIFTAQDAYRKIRLGASLLELITSMIYEGPQVISEINQGLVKLLKRDGFKNISEAVGIDNN